jgi:hypothetical protein
LPLVSLHTTPTSRRASGNALTLSKREQPRDTPSIFNLTGLEPGKWGAGYNDECRVAIQANQRFDFTTKIQKTGLGAGQ